MFDIAFEIRSFVNSALRLKSVGETFCPGVAATFGGDGFAGEEVVVSNSLTLVLGEEVVVVGPKTTNVSWQLQLRCLLQVLQ